MLAFMFETLCQSKFSLTSFPSFPRVSFNFARTGYADILQHNARIQPKTVVSRLHNDLQFGKMQGESFNNNPLSLCSNETVQSRLGSEKVTEAERELWDKWTLDSNSFAIPDETDNSKNSTDTDSVPPVRAFLWYENETVELASESIQLINWSTYFMQFCQEKRGIGISVTFFIIAFQPSLSTTWKWSIGFLRRGR
jgi:hypothetical protein